jgi:uncharacterized protein YndB with AHSA1/START domain
MMEVGQKNNITIQALIAAPVNLVWEKWNNPADIVKWNTASDDWHTTKAETDLRPGGAFSSRMEAKDGSFGFDFYGTYDKVIEYELLESTLGDNRKVTVIFKSEEGQTLVTQTFETENENPPELQQNGWQAILNNFKNYTESNL